MKQTSCVFFCLSLWLGATIRLASFPLPGTFCPRQKLLVPGLRVGPPHRTACSPGWGGKGSHNHVSVYSCSFLPFFWSFYIFSRNLSATSRCSVLLVCRCSSYFLGLRWVCCSFRSRIFCLCCPAFSLLSCQGDFTRLFPLMRRLSVVFRLCPPQSPVLQ